MEFGSFMEFPPVGSGGASAAFDQALAEVDAAEKFGLDAVWLAELHGAPERSVLSAPMMLASAIGARTSRIKIGIAVQVLPLSHPLRLAEEAATVDQISHGRLIYGIGRSGVVRTYEDYGISYGESRERFAETLEILKRAWTEPAFSYEGKYHSFDNVSVTPKPYQKPYPELRMAAATPETFPQIGRLGLPIFVAVRQGPFGQLAERIKSYREAYAAAGHPGNGQVFLRVPAYLAENRERARAEARDSIMGFFRYQAELGRDSARRAGGELAGAAAAPGRAAGGPDLRRSAGDAAPRRRSRRFREAVARGPGGDRARRHPRRTELRRQNPAGAGDQRAAPPLPGGQTPLPLTREPGGNPPGLFASARTAI